MPYIQAVNRYTIPTIDTETITVERGPRGIFVLALH